MWSRQPMKKKKKKNKTHAFCSRTLYAMEKSVLFSFFPLLSGLLGKELCVFAYFRATQDVNDQSFFSNSRSALLIYFDTSTKLLLCGDIYRVHLLLYRYGGAKYKQQRLRKTFVAFFFGMCGKGLTAGDGKGSVPWVCAVQRYGPLGLRLCILVVVPCIMMSECWERGVLMSAFGE